MIWLFLLDWGAGGYGFFLSGGFGWVGGWGVVINGDIIFELEECALEFGLFALVSFSSIAAIGKRDVANPQLCSHCRQLVICGTAVCAL